jgi:hypothetical protein
MPTRHHVVITGTGRAGTTFLVELLTHLGLDTGYSPKSVTRNKFPEARAGLEHDIRQSHCPFVVKSPDFCDYVDEVIYRDDLVIDHIFVPFRDLDAAAESRRYVHQTSVATLSLAKKVLHKLVPRVLAGGLWHTWTTKPGAQEAVLLRKIYQLMFAIADTTIPITLIRYPHLTKDQDYLFNKLKPILQTTTFDSFCAAFLQVVRPELVHRFSDKDH